MEKPICFSMESGGKAVYATENFLAYNNMCVGGMYICEDMLQEKYPPVVQ